LNEFALVGKSMSLIPAELKVICREIGLCDQSISDKSVEKQILQLIPKGEHTYEWVGVTTLVEYKFPGSDTATKTVRMIEIKTSNWNWLVQVFELLRKKYDATGTNAIMYAVLGSKDPHDVSELEKACKKNYVIRIYASQELLDNARIYPEISRDRLSAAAESCVIS
jgi:hypothetical protein